MAEERLQQIHQVRGIQANCVAYRSSTNEYRKMLKKACVDELRNLVNVEMSLEQVKVKAPKEDELPKIHFKQYNSKVVYSIRQAILL